MSSDRTRPTRIGLLGATGVTGRLVAAALSDDPAGATLRLGGRRPDALRRLVGSLEPRAGVETAAVDVCDAHTLAAFFDGLDVAVTCAGPFAELGPPVAEAAIAAGCHLVDVTGEQTWVRRCLASYDRPAAAAGVALVPAVGVDGGLADLAATLAASALPEPPYRIAIGFSVSDMATSPASRQSALGIVSAECERFVGGRLLPAHPGSAMRLLDLGPPGGVGWVTWIPGVEVLLVPRHLPCEQVDTWLRVPRLVASTLRRTSRVLPTLMRSPLGRAASRLHRWYGRSEPGERRHRTTFRVVVEVRDAAGGLRRVVMSGRDVYGLTGHIAAHGASRLAARRPDAPGGVFTPAQVFAPRPFLDALSPWLSVEVDDG